MLEDGGNGEKNKNKAPPINASYNILFEELKKMSDDLNEMRNMYADLNEVKTKIVDLKEKVENGFKKVKTKVVNLEDKVENGFKKVFARLKENHKIWMRIER